MGVKNVHRNQIAPTQLTARLSLRVSFDQPFVRLAICAKSDILEGCHRVVLHRINNAQQFRRRRETFQQLMLADLQDAGRIVARLLLEFEFARAVVDQAA